ncbi:MAG TPA: 4a-hydroxytetrahydrobiopterin dehydratase [Candidatus Dormibacteraeota bacterium]|nr:4a-hydroxytetrahydrobiopterin dehydratase [Candidatus Dormibacteraeota bacterium]
MSELARERCHACSQDTPTVTAEEQGALLTELDAGWEVEDRWLRRHFKSPNFSGAFTLATRVALLAEREGHHPDLRLGWGYLVVELTTHAAGGLTRNDFILAAKIDLAAVATAGS